MTIELIESIEQGKASVFEEKLNARLDAMAEEVIKKKYDEMYGIAEEKDEDDEEDEDDYEDDENEDED